MHQQHTWMRFGLGGIDSTGQPQGEHVDESPLTKCVTTTGVTSTRAGAGSEVGAELVALAPTKVLRPSCGHEQRHDAIQDTKQREKDRDG
jgi:hypothetical protein